MSYRHFASDEDLMSRVDSGWLDQKYLDGLRLGAHPDSRNGILHEIATTLLRQYKRPFYTQSTVDDAAAFQGNPAVYEGEDGA